MTEPRRTTTSTAAAALAAVLITLAGCSSGDSAGTAGTQGPDAGNAPDAAERDSRSGGGDAGELGAPDGSETGAPDSGDGTSDAGDAGPGRATEAWTRLVGSSELDRLHDVEFGPRGSLYATGTTKGDLHGNGSGNGFAAFVVKYDPSGVRDWTKVLGKDFLESVLGSEVTFNEVEGFSLDVSGKGNVYVAGRADWQSNSSTPPNTGFLVRFAPDGDMGWKKLIGDGLDPATKTEARAVTVDAPGSVWVGGKSSNPNGESALLSGADGPVSWIARHDPETGEELWIEGFAPGDIASGVRGLDTGPSGNAYAAGSTDGEVDGEQTRADSGDGYVASFNPSGNMRWASLVGSVKRDQIEDVAVSTEGARAAIGVVGLTEGSIAGSTFQGGPDDAFAAEVGVEGGVQWVETIGGSGSENLAGVSPATGGGFVAAGSVQGDLPGTKPKVGRVDALIARVSPSGSISPRRWGSPSANLAEAVDVEGRSFYVGGVTDGSLGGRTFNGGNNDGFVTRFDGGGDGRNE